jgi:hypothetical protein
MTLPLQFYYLNFNPENPIPNGPFSYPQSDYLQGPWFPLIIGSGLTVDLATSTISATGGGGGGVTQIVAGAGVSVSPVGGTGVVTISATGGGGGVTQIIAGTGVSISPVGGTGAVTINATGGGSVTWATLGGKTGASGPSEIALGLNAGASQGTYAVAIGENAGTTSQGLGAVALGYGAGNANQALAAVAIGGGAGNVNQGGCAVAVGQSAGGSGQGDEALALGSQAAASAVQASCSIVINASGAPLDNTVSNTTVIKPVRNAGSSGLPAGFFQVAYNPTTGELVYYS